MKKSAADILRLSKINRMEVQGDRYDEGQHQAALIQWARDTSELQTEPTKAKALKWFHSIPNGTFPGEGFEKRSGVIMPSLTAVRMKAEGLTKGVTDLRLDYVVRDEAGGIICPGLVAEMKKPRKTASTEQHDYLEFMRSQGFATYVWTEWQRAALDISGFMQLSAIAPIYVEEQGRMRTFQKFSIDLLLLVGI
jgi:hypothetical protein